jgi:2-polyprenyl-3-methyl-5-hydroxy-6-metoxy-1,4-benzoquinol methylase
MRPRYPAQDIVECPNCRLVFFDGALPGGLYAEEYFGGSEYLDYAADKAFLQRNFRRQLPTLRQLAPGGRLLEVGCAYGFFLEVVRPFWEGKGVDVSAGAIRHARQTLGLNAVEAEFLELPEEPETYDLICLWDTVEHLPHPVRVIEKAARWLKPGGALVLTTGNIDSSVARFRKERWRQIHPPTHLYYFSPATLGRAVEGAGLTVADVSSVGYSRGFRAMAYGALVVREKPHRWLYDLVTLGGRIDFPVYLNLYDIFRMIALKPLSGETSARSGAGRRQMPRR